jgi:deoxyhypusine synthase
MKKMAENLAYIRDKVLEYVQNKDDTIDIDFVKTVIGDFTSAYFKSIRHQLIYQEIQDVGRIHAPASVYRKYTELLKQFVDSMIATNKDGGIYSANSR